MRGRLLGIDHGTRVIGLAVCDANWTAARPLELLKRRSRAQDFAAINAIITRHEIAAVVVGLPELPPDLTATSQAPIVQGWAARLAAAIQPPVYLWNEQYSTFEAQALAAEAGTRTGKRIDHLAAAVILQSFIDFHSSGAELPPAIKRPETDS